MTSRTRRALDPALSPVVVAVSVVTFVRVWVTVVVVVAMSARVTVWVKKSARANRHSTATL